MIMNKIKLLLPLIAALSVAQAQAKEPAKISVISYNIRYGAAQDGPNAWEIRCQASPEMIKKQQPDIFGLQEAYDFQVEYLAEHLPQYKWVGVGRNDGKTLGEFMAIFYNTSTTKLLDWGTYWLSDTPEVPSRCWEGNDNRSLTWALLKDKRSGKKYYYLNTHFEVNPEANVKCGAVAVKLIERINPQGLPLILTADFNAEPGSETLKPIDAVLSSARDTAVESDKGGTYHGWGVVSIPIDHIYYSDGFSSCDKFEVVKWQYYGRNFISDHYPVKAILNIK